MKREILAVILILAVVFIGIFIIYSLNSKVSLNPSERIRKTENTVKEEIVKAGELEIIHFDNENPYQEYYLRDIENGERIRFYPNQELGIISGALVRISGKYINKKLIVSADEGFEVLEAGLSPLNYTSHIPETIGAQKTAVILVRFADSQQHPFEKEEVYNSIFDGQVNDFLLESSFNKTWLEGNVFGWYTSQYNCDYLGGFLPDMVEAIGLADSDIYYPDYNRLIFITDSFCNDIPNGYATVGMVTLDSPQDGRFIASYAVIRNSIHFFDEVEMPSGGHRPYNWTSGPGLIIHEFGHNLGAGHSNALECGEYSISGGCYVINYGGLFDVMGKGWNFEYRTNAAYHFSSFFKLLFKWIDSKEVIDKPGIYTLSPLEKIPTRIAEVKRPASYPDQSSYFLENRIPYGYDESLNDPLSIGNKEGIFINLLKENAINIELIDMTPLTIAADQDWYDVALTSGKTFFDEGAGVKITNLGLVEGNSQFIKFSVEYLTPACVFYNPLIRFIFSNNLTAHPGDSYIQLNWRFYNTDTILCNASDLEFDIDLPDGWEIIDNGGNSVNFPIAFNNTSPGDDLYFDHFLQIPSNATYGNYTLNLHLLNLNSGHSSSANFYVEIIP